MVHLTQLDELPPALLTARACEVDDILPGPTLIHLAGRREQPLFVSILLHGNEDVGLLAIQQVLQEHQAQQLPRALSIFVGNVEAARHGVRRLDHQPDSNRVWPGSDTEGTAEHALMQSVVDEMRCRAVFASIDLHNNTGRNPHYGCVNRMDHKHLQLASLFSRTVVFFLRPHGVQSQAFATFCPAVTCECGKVGDATGVTRAAEFVRSCLHLSEIPDHELPEGDVHVFRTVATAKVRPNAAFGFSSALDGENNGTQDASPISRRALAPVGAQDVENKGTQDASSRSFTFRVGMGAGQDESNVDQDKRRATLGSDQLEDYDLLLRGDIEELNFQELPVGCVVGQARSSQELPLQVWDQEGRDATHEYLEFLNGSIVLRRQVMPSMLTRLSSVIRQDCLGYFMERQPTDSAIKPFPAHS